MFCKKQHRKEVKQQEKDLQIQDAQIWELKRELDKHEKFYDNIAKLADYPKYKYQIMKSGESICFVLKYAERVDKELQKYSFFAVLYDMRHGRGVGEIEVEVYLADKQVRLEFLSVGPEHRRKGYATFMLQYLIHYCTHHCWEKIYCHIADRGCIGIENVRNFYKENGFEIDHNDNAVYLL